MKKDSTPQQFTPLCTKAFTQLTTEEKETLAVNFIDAEKTFHSVDLWNIHRQRKSGLEKRRLNEIGF